jgi:hypothetical protein
LQEAFDLASGTKGRGFESRIAHQKSQALGALPSAFLPLGYKPPALETIQSPPFAEFTPPIRSVSLREEYPRPLNYRVVQKLMAEHPLQIK